MKIKLFFLLLIITFSVHSQSKQPFKSIGKTIKVATLSNGQFDEFFDEDSIQRVGTALININTHKIVKIQLSESEIEELDNAKASRFLSVDPLASNYPMLTPYQFASNTPIVAIDLDGLEGEWVSKGIWDARKQIAKKDGNNAAREYDKGVRTGALLTTVTIVDILLTKGWISKTIMGSQVIGAFEHNRAKTPEGRIAQDDRSKEALVDAFIISGVSKFIGIAGKIAVETVKPINS